MVTIYNLKDLTMVTIVTINVQIMFCGNKLSENKVFGKKF